MASVNEYERARNERILANETKLKSLKIKEVAAALKPNAAVPVAPQGGTIAAWHLLDWKHQRCLVLTWLPLQAYPQAQGAAQGPANQSFTQVCKVQEALNCLSQLSVAVTWELLTLCNISHNDAQAPRQGCTGIC